MERSSVPWQAPWHVCSSLLCDMDIKESYIWRDRVADIWRDRVADIWRDRVAGIKAKIS